jgi:hypothetical protein
MPNAIRQGPASSIANPYPMHTASATEQADSNHRH